MTRGQTSRTDTSTLLFLSSTTEIVNRFSSLVNKADDLLVERFLVFSLCSCSFWLCPSLPYHFSSPHPLPLPTLSFSSRSFSLFSISPAPPCITSLFCPLLLPCPLLVTQNVENGRREVDGSSIPRWDTTNAHRNNPGHHLSHCPSVDLGRK